MRQLGELINCAKQKGRGMLVYLFIAKAYRQGAVIRPPGLSIGAANEHLWSLREHLSTTRLYKNTFLGSLKNSKLMGSSA